MYYKFQSTKMVGGPSQWVRAPAYQFPVIHRKSDILEAIKGRDEFKFRDCGDHETLNYVVNLEDSFPHIDPRHSRFDDFAILRRECRGIAFDKETGLIIRRPPHKFFNLNERPEVNQDIIDWHSPYTIMTKEDGSCISAYKDSTGRIIWGTPAGETEWTPYVEKFVSENPQYQAAAIYLIDLGWTPTFEFCAQVNRIVVLHEKPRLPLTCVRQLNSGIYLPYEQMIALREFGIEVTEKVDVIAQYDQAKNKVLKPIDVLIEAAHTLEGTEGWVIRFDSGHMLKVKTDWYRDIHGCVTEIRFEKDVLALILNKRLDDINEFLTDTMRDKINAHAEEMHEGFMKVAHYICMAVYHSEHMTKKEFARQFHRDQYFSFMADLFDRKDSTNNWMTDTYEKLWVYVRDRLTSQTWVDRLRHLYDNKKFEF